jgi:hypothetical protein
MKTLSSQEVKQALWEILEQLPSDRIATGRTEL